MESIITLKNVSKSFKTANQPLHVLADVDLIINSGEFFMFLGPSGSGKSTVLRVMSGLEKDYRGKVKKLRDDQKIKRQEFVKLFYGY